MKSETTTLEQATKKVLSTLKRNSSRKTGLTSIGRMDLLENLGYTPRTIDRAIKNLKDSKTITKMGTTYKFN